MKKGRSFFDLLPFFLFMVQISFPKNRLYEGYTIPPYYDSMIAKVIVHARTRNEAILKMKRALEECVIEGIDTNIDFLFKILSNEDFVNNNYDTSFLGK